MKGITIAVSDLRNPDFVKAIKSLYETGIIDLPDPVVGFYPDFPEPVDFTEILGLYKDIGAL